jgi:aquaporin related protein
MRERVFSKNLEHLHPSSHWRSEIHLSYLDSCALRNTIFPTMSTNGTHKDTEAGLPYTEPRTTSPSRKERKPILHPHSYRTEATAFIGEFIGTFMFLSLAFCGTQIALNGASVQRLSVDDTAPQVGTLLYIAFAFGVSLAINVAIFADVSGAKFNPAVSC